MNSNWCLLNSEPYVSDVTRQMQACDWDEVSSLFQSLYRNCPEATLLVDLDGRIIEMNCTAESLLGYPRSLLLGKEIDALIPERLRKRYAHLRPRNVDPPRASRLSLYARLLGGRELPVDVVICPVVLNNTQLFLVEARDMTDYRELCDSLQKSRDEALSATNCKSQFLANMSHEIRTPLNAIVGMIDLLRETPLNDEQKELATIASSSSATLIDIVNDILDFSKIEAGVTQIELQDFDIVEVVEGMADMLKSQAHMKGLTFVTLVSPEIPPLVRGDPARVRQVLTNLTQNAIKFTERGEVMVEVQVDAWQKVIRFIVTDTGIGLSPDDQARLFEPFLQADDSITRRYGGTGLGLSISKSLVKQMGGNIGIESRVGMGSHFWFTIPWEKALSLSANRFPNIDPGKTHLLVVDGPSSSKQMIRTYAESWGLKYHEALTGKAALNLLDQQAKAGTPIDIVFMDPVMPDMDACELANELQHRHFRSDTKLVLITSTPKEQLSSQVSQFNFAGCLTRPIKRSDLFDCLRLALSGDSSAPAKETLEAAVLIKDVDRNPAEPRTILIAEDNSANQKLAQAYLHRLGYATNTVGTGKEVVEAALHNNYATILMDVQMPDMDGLEATKAIRQAELELGHHVPIIAITAHVSQEYRNKCLAAGMDGYVSKPITQHKLKEALDRWIA